MLIYATWHSSVAAQCSKNHCYKKALSGHDIRCSKVILSPNYIFTKYYYKFSALFHVFKIIC